VGDTVQAKLSIGIVAMIVACLAGADAARAGNLTFHGFDPPATYTGEAGMRFCYGRTTTGQNLYDSTGLFLVSRLTYVDTSIFSAEAYGRSDLNTGWFVKGQIGGGQLEGVLTNQVTDAIKVGVGGRYWRAQTQGLTHFEGHVSGDIGVPQPVDWRTDNAGVFFQTGLRFGPNLIICSN